MRMGYGRTWSSLRETFLGPSFGTPKADRASFVLYATHHHHHLHSKPTWTELVRSGVELPPTYATRAEYDKVALSTLYQRARGRRSKEAKDQD
jgi:hypothetical protein